MKYPSGTFAGLALMENEVGEDAYLYLGSEDGKLFEVQLNRSGRGCVLEAEPSIPPAAEYAVEPKPSNPPAPEYAVEPTPSNSPAPEDTVESKPSNPPAADPAVESKPSNPTVPAASGAVITVVVTAVVAGTVVAIVIIASFMCLRRRARRRPAGPERALEVVRFQSPVGMYGAHEHRFQVAKGLGYLHDFARPPIIHRDLKSSNILLGEGSGEKLHVVVADFGLAAIGERVLDTGHNHVVLTSHIGGTFGYMSPEYMLRGELSEKNDVYSFGVLVLELLTGRKVVGPAPSGLGWQTLVEWVKPFLLGAVVESGSMEMPYPILDRCLWDQVAGDSIKKNMVMNTFQLAWECVEEEYGSRPAMREIIQHIHSIFLGVGWDGLTVMMVDLENDVDNDAVTATGGLRV
ncbi:hypothetical protein CBR_g50556 [Chara braunii]|uniref:Protein kinase domain-containing protein n=1 Tax=Chara braunii TaxID=69332 RepID=A0A388M6T2_CHABU|nr:hypothetical protein CBR_g50556 [Chara braunii]|eukprot:GBG90307.1 hypothetical protein CBR_g50556 [Chara braunii]